MVRNEFSDKFRTHSMQVRTRELLFENWAMGDGSVPLRKGGGDPSCQRSAVRMSRDGEPFGPSLSMSGEVDGQRRFMNDRGYEMTRCHCLTSRSKLVRPMHSYGIDGRK